METQKEVVRIMDKSDILQHIPFDEYEGSQYNETKDIHFEGFNKYKKTGGTPLQCVNTYYYNDFDFDMDKNGMEKFVAMLCGMLFEMQHNEVDEDQAFGTAWDILDFETGNYDDLFNDEDLALIKADIKTIKEYLKTQPELMEEVKEKRKKAQSE